ncbi:MAG: YggS family pyridoxal phosphate-dependent enzyme, partial [Actinobacteria bacterium]|nr:YggS family pyridoxal phosphate-dependent enzyme [Actinomycetota bacterium]
MDIKTNYQKLKEEIPCRVTIVVAAKTRKAEEISEVIKAGATDIGENYVQEALAVQRELGEEARKVRWHLIGPLQKNKINQALSIFDVIQTIGDYEIAHEIDKRVEKSGKTLIPVYIEINIADEKNKYGVKPEIESILELIKKIAANLGHIKIEGLMTMGPFVDNPEKLRPYFRKARMIFEKIKNTNI